LSDPITGLGRRKIPTSSQKPSKATNVPIVYPRLLYRNFSHLTRNTIHEGDVVFVSKHAALFGTAESRLSRICSWRDVDAFLQTDQCTLYPNDIESKKIILQSRRVMRSVRLNRLNDSLALKRAMRRANQPVSFSMDEQIQVLRGSVKRAKKCVNAAKKAITTNTPLEIVPGEDWLFVKAFVDWKIDGVLHSKELSDNQVSECYPTSDEAECLMNICVHGPCMVRNHSHVKEKQFFDDAVSPGDMLFLCIVAEFKPADVVGFRIRLATSRQIAHLMTSQSAACAPGGKVTDFGIDDLLSTVAVWKLSRVIDDRKVVLATKGVEASVAIEMLLIDDFWEMISPGSGVSAMQQRMMLYDKRMMRDALKNYKRELAEKERMKAYMKMLERLAKEEALRKKAAKKLGEAGRGLLKRRQERLAKEEALRQEAAGKLGKAGKQVVKRRKERLAKEEALRQEAAGKLGKAGKRIVTRRRLIAMRSAISIQIQARKAILRRMAIKELENRRRSKRLRLELQRLLWQVATAEKQRIEIETRLREEALALDEEARVALEQEIEKARIEAERLRAEAEEARRLEEEARLQEEAARQAALAEADALRRKIEEEEKTAREINAEIEKIGAEQVAGRTELSRGDDAAIQNETDVQRLESELQDAMQDYADAEAAEEQDEEMIDLPIEEVTDDEEEEEDFFTDEEVITDDDEFFSDEGEPDTEDEEFLTDEGESDAEDKVDTEDLETVDAAEAKSFELVVREERAIQSMLKIATKRRSLMSTMVEVGLPVSAAMQLAQGQLWRSIIERQSSQRQKAYRGAAPSDFAETVSEIDNPDGLGMVPIQRKRTEDERVFQTLYNRMKQAQRAGTMEAAPAKDWSIGWFKEKYEGSLEWAGLPISWNTTEVTKGRMLCATSVGMYNRVMSRPRVHQAQYYVSSKFLHDIGYGFAVDSQAAIGVELTDYASICAGFLNLADGGLLHRLCVVLADSQTPDGDKAFPYVVEKGRIKFMPPQEVDGVMQFPSGFNVQDLLEKAQGSTLEQKSRALSKSLNFLFCLADTRKWKLDDGYLKRATDDKALWKYAENSMDEHIEDLYDASTTNGVSMTASQALVRFIVFGLASYARLGQGTVNKIESEMTSVKAISDYRGGGPSLYKNSTQPPAEVDSLMGSRTFSPDSSSGFKLLPEGTELDNVPKALFYKGEANFALANASLPPLGSAPPAALNRVGLPEGVPTPYQNVVDMNTDNFTHWVESVPTEHLRAVRDGYLKNTLGLKGETFTRLSSIVNRVKKEREDLVSFQRSYPPAPPPDIDIRADENITLFEEATTFQEPRVSDEVDEDEEEEEEWDSLDGPDTRFAGSVRDSLYEFGAGAASAVGSGLYAGAEVAGNGVLRFAVASLTE
jgi:hypothetical protein